MSKKIVSSMDQPFEKLSEEDQRIWEIVAKRVRPLGTPQSKPKDFQKRKIKKSPIPSRNLTRIVFFEAEGVAQRPPEKLFPETVRVLDLHGFTVQEAYSVFRAFMEKARGKSWQEVEIITGLGTSGKGIIRRELRHWLERKEYSSRITEIFHPLNNLGALRIKFSVREKR